MVSDTDTVANVTAGDSSSGSVLYTGITREGLWKIFMMQLMDK